MIIEPSGAFSSLPNLLLSVGLTRPCWPQEVRKDFGKLCEQAGLGKGWHPHGTRHTWVSLLADAGVDLEDIADAAGHVTSAVTRNFYRHQLADKLTRASAAMDAIFRPGEVSGS
jgi:integrase